ESVSHLWWWNPRSWEPRERPGSRGALSSFGGGSRRPVLDDCRLRSAREWKDSVLHHHRHEDSRYASGAERTTVESVQRSQATRRGGPGNDRRDTAHDLSRRRLTRASNDGRSAPHASADPPSLDI